jgi:hypothetical protein
MIGLSISTQSPDLLLTATTYLESLYETLLRQQAVSSKMHKAFKV